MTDAPERIWAVLSDIFDNLGLWQDAAPTDEPYAVEYVRVIPASEDAGDDARIAAASRREWAERAWAAEAERDRLREALMDIDACDPEGLESGFSESAVRGLVSRMGAIARAALKGATAEK